MSVCSQTRPKSPFVKAAWSVCYTSNNVASCWQPNHGNNTTSRTTPFPSHLLFQSSCNASSISGNMATVPTIFVWDETFEAYVLTESRPAPGQKTIDGSLLALDEDLLERAKKLKERGLRRTNKYLKHLSDSSKYLRWPMTKPRDVALHNLKALAGHYPIVIPSLDANHGTQLSISISPDCAANSLELEHHPEETNIVIHLVDFSELIPARHRHLRATQMKHEGPVDLGAQPSVNKCEDSSPPVSHRDENHNMQLLRSDTRPPTLVHIVGRFMTREANADRVHNLDLSKGWEPTVFVVAIDLNFNARGKKAVWAIRDYNSSITGKYVKKAPVDATTALQDVKGSVNRLRSVWPAFDAKMTFDAAQLARSVDDFRTSYVEDMGRMVGKTAGTWKLDIVAIEAED